MKKIITITMVLLLVSVVLPGGTVEAEEYGVFLWGYTVASYDGNARWYDPEMGTYQGNITAIEINDLNMSPRGADDAINDRFGKAETYDISFYEWDATPYEQEPWEWRTSPDEYGENLIFLAEYQHYDENTKEYINYTWATNWHAFGKYTPLDPMEHFARYEPIPTPELNPYNDDNVGPTWINLSMPHFKYTASSMEGEPIRQGTFDLFQSYAIFVREEGEQKWYYMGNSALDLKNPATHEPLPATEDKIPPEEINTGSQYFLATDLRPDTNYEFMVRVNYRTLDEPNLGPVWGYGGGLGGMSEGSEEQLNGRAPDGGSITGFGGSKGSLVPTGSADLPSEPREFTASSGIGNVFLEWLPPLDNGGTPLEYYRIYRNMTDSGFEYYDTIPASDTNYGDSEVTNGVEYTYYVTAVNAMGEGPASNQDSAIPLGVASPPQNLVATGYMDMIHVEWDPPETDGGSSITEYWVYRDGSYYDYVTVDFTSYNDTSVTSGVEYTYYTRARNSVGLGPASNEDSAVAYTTTSIPLSAGGPSGGWNYISSTVIPDETGITDILDDPAYGIAGLYDRVMYYDGASHQWKSYVPGRDDHYNNLHSWDHTMGIWIRMTDNAILTIRGIEPASTDITLYPGWNMVGYPSNITGNNNLPNEVSIIGYFDADMEYNIAYDYDPSSFVFEPGKAYWVYNDEDFAVIWTVEY